MVGSSKQAGYNKAYKSLLLVSDTGNVFSFVLLKANGLLKHSKKSSYNSKEVVSHTMVGNKQLLKVLMMAQNNLTLKQTKSS